MKTTLTIGLAIVTVILGVILVKVTYFPASTVTSSDTIHSDYKPVLSEKSTTENNMTSTEADIQLKRDRGDSARGAQKGNSDASTLQNDLDSIGNP